MQNDKHGTPTANACGIQSYRISKKREGRLMRKTLTATTTMRMRKVGQRTATDEQMSTAEGRVELQLRRKENGRKRRAATEKRPNFQGGRWTTYDCIVERTETAERMGALDRSNGEEFETKHWSFWNLKFEMTCLVSVTWQWEIGTIILKLRILKIWNWILNHSRHFLGPVWILILVRPWSG